MDRLIFFDINGTIIKRDDKTDIPYELAIDKYLQVENGMNGVDTSARSDKDVFHEVLRKYDQQFSEEKWKEFLKIYEEYLEEYADSDIWQANVDIVEFLEKISTTNCALAIISGELRMGARYKLSKIGVWEYFMDGGFGEDGLERKDIAFTALDRIEKKLNKKFEKIIVIGDTIKDIKIARLFKAKIVSIATGSNTYEELKKYNPDFLVRKFEEIDLDKLLSE